MWQIVTLNIKVKVVALVVEVVITRSHHLKAEDGSRWQGQYKRDA